MRAAVALLLAVAAGAPARPRLHGFHEDVRGGEPTIDAWSILITISATHEPSVKGVRRRGHYGGEIAPCSPPADVRDALFASFPERRPGDWTLADVVVTSLDARGRPICMRIYALILMGPHERYPQYPLSFGAHIPITDHAKAIRISGWRGMRQKTFPLP